MRPSMRRRGSIRRFWAVAGSMLAMISLCLLVGCDRLSARRRANDAARLYEGGRLAEAADLYAEAFRLDPSLATLALNLGFAHLGAFRAALAPEARERHGLGAITAFERFCELSPTDSRGKSYLLEAFVTTKRYAEAEAYYRPLIDRAAPSGEALAAMSRIAGKLGRIDTALAFAERLRTLEPDSPEAHQAVGVLIFEHLLAHPELTPPERLALADQGIAALERASALAPNAPDPRAYLNLLHRQRAIGLIPGITCEAESCEASRAQALERADAFEKEARARMASATRADHAEPPASVVPNAR